MVTRRILSFRRDDKGSPHNDNTPPHIKSALKIITTHSDNGELYFVVQCGCVANVEQLVFQTVIKMIDGTTVTKLSCVVWFLGLAQILEASTMFFKVNCYVF